MKESVQKTNVISPEEVNRKIAERLAYHSKRRKEKEKIKDEEVNE